MEIRKAVLRLPAQFAPNRWLWQVCQGERVAWGRVETRAEARKKVKRAVQQVSSMEWWRG